MKVKPLIKYIGNKHRVASHIVSSFPKSYNTYFEPFAGSLAVLGHLRPKRSVASDVLKPLIEMWQLVKTRPNELAESYSESWHKYRKNKLETYEAVKARFNKSPNPHDFLFISRTCYGGVLRFRRDGYLSTPIGPHDAISPDEFKGRLFAWNKIVQNTEFILSDFEEVIKLAGQDDIVYCDPPYVDTQKIIYGAQDFSLKRLYEALWAAKKRGCFCALSIDGQKKSGRKKINVAPPNGLFEVETFVSLGGSMLKRFWRDGQDVSDEMVKDRLLVTRDVTERQLDLLNLTLRAKPT